MTTLTEGRLQINANGAVNGRKFDDEHHGLNHCMKAVDFIIEFSDCYWFVEVKNPDAPEVPNENRKEFMEQFESGKIDSDLTYKYRDSFLYEWASKRADKPVDYYVLIALDALDAALLQSRKEALRRNLPVSGPKSEPWPRPIVRRCGVFNIASWNRHFPACQFTPLP